MSTIHRSKYRMGVSLAWKFYHEIPAELVRSSALKIKTGKTL
jgi:hypothetical protein